MQMRYTEEKLNTFSKETLIQLFLAQQEQLSEIDKKLQLVLEQLAVMNQNRYGRKTEQMPVPQQMAFADVNGELVMFNEAEALASLDENEEETVSKKHPVKKKEKRETGSRPFRDPCHKSGTLSDRRRTEGTFWKKRMEAASR